MELRYSGGCLCGAVRYELAAAPRDLCYCYCNTCRRAAGAPAVPWGTVALAEFRVVRGTLSEYRSSPPVVRGHCGTCGTSLSYRHAARPADIDVTLASLDEPARFPPQRHLWVADKLPWVAISDGLPQFAGGMSGGAVP